MMPPELLVDRVESVAIITMNRPAAGNALSASLRAALVAAFQAASDDEAVRAVVLTGAGRRSFCGGLDLKELASSGRPFAALESDPVAAVARCRKPVIAAVNGAAVTGGFELALACDIRLCSTGARFTDSHVQIGVVPGWGLSQRLPKLIGLGRAKEIALSGGTIEADQALKWGLANAVVPPDALLDEALALAQRIAAYRPEVVEIYRSLLDKSAAGPPEADLAMEASVAAEYNKSLSSSALTP